MLGCAAPDDAAPTPRHIHQDVYNSFYFSHDFSGGSEADCRTFADDTITTIKANVASTQETLNGVGAEPGQEPGQACAAMGQDQVQAEKAKLIAAKTAAENAENDAASKQRAKAAATSATFTATFDLMTDAPVSCRDPTGQESYQVVKNAADTAIAKLATAKQTLVDAKAAVTAAEAAHTNVVNEASRLKSSCLCRVHKEQKAAMAAASTTTASHATDWKQAHELICALDKTTTCTVPTCPTVTQSTVAAGVANADTEHCLPEPDFVWSGVNWYRVQVQGSMNSNDKLKAACTAKHPNLRPICDYWANGCTASRPCAGAAGAAVLDSTGKQRCIVVPNHGNFYWSLPSQNLLNGFYSSGMYQGRNSNFWSTGIESNVPYTSSGSSHRRATANDRDQYTMCTNFEEDTVPLKCVSTNGKCPK